MLSKLFYLSASLCICTFISAQQKTETKLTTENKKPVFVLPDSAKTKGEKIVSAARWQIGKTTTYDPSYVSLKYPKGDIPIKKGVCTDVVIRALRHALNIDLQEKVHNDMKKNFSKYPKIWGLTRTDKNIDHRRVPNLRKYFSRMGYSLAVTRDKANYKPGDLITCTVAGRLPHIAIVSDKINKDGVPHIIHNIGLGTKEDDDLFTYPLTGHYRLK